MGVGSSNAVTWKVAALAAATVSVLALTACDYWSNVNRIGVSTDDDGSVQIVYLACGYERLAAVALYDYHDPTTGEDDELLWEIRSEAGTGGGVFTVGSQPEGFVETVPFKGELADNLIATVEIEDSVGAVISFAPTDLEPGQVFANAQTSTNMDAVAFEQRAHESCEAAQ
jgi:hypothetical protein